MSTIHLIIGNTEFDVPRELLEKSAFFRGMLEIQGDNLQIDNVSPEIFGILIYMLKHGNENVITELVNLYEYLNFEMNCITLATSYCTTNSCTKMIIKGKYCELHKCRALNCANVKSSGFDYCTTHMCKTSGCTSILLDGKEGYNCRNYCEAHRCKRNECERQGAFWGLCEHHKCNINFCTNEAARYAQYCDEHKCTHDDCEEVVKEGYALCEKHKCIVFSCNKIRVENDYDTNYICSVTYYDFCEEHKCKYDSCTEIRLPQIEYCSEHK